MRGLGAASRRGREVRVSFSGGAIHTPRCRPGCGVRRPLPDDGWIISPTAATRHRRAGIRNTPGTPSQSTAATPVPNRASSSILSPRHARAFAYRTRRHLTAGSRATSWNRVGLNGTAFTAVTAWRELGEAGRRPVPARRVLQVIDPCGVGARWRSCPTSVAVVGWC